MANQKSRAKTFNGMNYRKVQQENSERRSKLQKEDLKWLKENRLKNVGWENVIALFQKIEEFLDKNRLNDWSLEDLFLEADRIGNKYQTAQEIEAFNQQMAEEVNAIAEEVDRQFPDTEAEIIDFSNHARTRRK
jgi:hypothetical protein